MGHKDKVKEGKKERKVAARARYLRHTLIRLPNRDASKTLVQKPVITPWPAS
jgi:hypothetical protein